MILDGICTDKKYPFSIINNLIGQLNKYCNSSTRYHVIM